MLTSKIVIFFKEGLVDQRFNLLAWKALCAVENTGSITDAAAELRTDPSTVSRLIAHLEAALGQTLVRRTERPAMMTQIGREIAKKAEPVLNAHAAFLARIANDTGTMAGTIRLYVDPNIIDDSLMSILTDFQTLYPMVNFRITANSTMADCLVGAVDVVVVSQKPQNKALYCLTQGCCVFIPVASESYLKKHPKPMKPEDLIKHTGFIYDQSNAEQSLSLHCQALVSKVRYKNSVVTCHHNSSPFLLRKRNRLRTTSSHLRRLASTPDVGLLRLFECPLAHTPHSSFHSMVEQPPYRGIREH